MLSRRNLESFLYDDSVLVALCNEHRRPGLISDVLQDKATALAEAVARGNPADDIKSAAGMIYTKVKSRLSLTGVGNDAKAFERNVLAHLVQPGMQVYEELKASIF